MAASVPTTDPIARRRAIALVTCALASACGFRPLHGPSGEAAALRGDIVIEGVDGRSGHYFQRSFTRIAGEPEPDARFALDVALSLDREGLAISRDDTITRFDVFGEARFRLRDRTSGALRLDGVARSVSAFNTLSNPYATRIARLDAERRVAEDLAARVYAQIAARQTASDLAPAPPSPITPGRMPERP